MSCNAMHLPVEMWLAAIARFVHGVVDLLQHRIGGGRTFARDGFDEQLLFDALVIILVGDLNTHDLLSQY